MTITAPPTTTPEALRPVAFDLYRDIHKGIRAELFALTTDTGRLDPTDDLGVAAVAEHVRSLVQFLVAHAEHEDGQIQPVLAQQLPQLASTIAIDHDALERRMVLLVQLADVARTTVAPDRRRALHELYVELAAFTSAYLAHQDVEERIVGPALEAAVGVDAVIRIHERILAGIPPQEMGEAVAVMLPAMNVDDRAEMLGAIKAEAPAEAFAGMWGLAGSVLAVDDLRAVAVRLGVAA